MKRILRSILDIDSTISQEHLTQNFDKLRHSSLACDRPEDEKILGFVKQYWSVRMELPSLQTVKDYFEDDTDIQERLKDVEGADRYIRTNFAHLVQQLLDRQNQHRAVMLLKEAHEIITKGLMIQEGKEKIKKMGVRDGLIHFASRANDLIVPEHNAKLRGDIREDGQAVWEEYLTAKNNKDKAWGRFTGINTIDIACHGLKKGEMHVHAAYAGHLKTSFALNWCYNLVTRYRTNVFYGCFEMKYEHLRRIIYVIHSSNMRWKALGYQPLDYRKVRDGELTPEEEAFYQLVIEDFNNNPEYCHFEVWAPDHDVDIDEVRIEAEMLHKELEIGFVVLDHGGLMEARKGKKNANYGVELNSVLRDSKKFALQFNKGEGIPLLMLFQINRQGLTEADKNDGVYKMNALSWASEAERSADVVTATYLDDNVGKTHRTNNQTKFCNLKNRDNPHFDPFLASVNFKTRRISNLDTTEHTGRNMSVEHHQDLMTLMNNV